MLSQFNKLVKQGYSLRGAFTVPVTDLERGVCEWQPKASTAMLGRVDFPVDCHMSRRDRDIAIVARDQIGRVSAARAYKIPDARRASCPA